MSRTMKIPRETWTAAFLERLGRAREEGEAGAVDDDRLQPGLNAPAQVLIYHRTVTSTNELLRTAAREGAGAGTVILADAQTAGRGRHGRTWFSPAGGGRYCSLLIGPGIAPDRTGWITLAAALALVRAARPLGIAPGIKWPNDIECGGRKVAGILAETTSQEETVGGIVLGVGINVDWSGCEVPPEVDERGTTLSGCAGRPVDGDRFIADYLWEVWPLVSHLVEASGEPDVPPRFMSEVMAHLQHLGEPVTVRAAGGEVSGICTGLTAEGYLTLDGGRRVVAGELVTPT
jgi:BirA family biotin operon repressor/biotin-[acetyl-CoA-carboxylase] ligase